MICISSRGLSGRRLRGTRMRVTVWAKAFGQMEKHLRLQGMRQMLALIIDTDLHAAGGKIVAQLRMIAAIDKHQPPGVQRQRQRITLFSTERGSLIGDKATVK